MRLLSSSLLACALIATAVGAVSEARAQSGREPAMAERMAPPPPPRQDPPRQNASSSLSDAVRRVQRETGGQVLGAERIQFDGRDINRVKVMDDRGRVRYMDEDPQRPRESFDRRRETPDPPNTARGDNPRRP